MSRLEELIAELCPEGVEFKRLGECCNLEKGNTPIQKAVSGEYPLVVTTEERKSSNTYQFDAPTVCIPLVSSRGHGIASLNQVYYQEGKFALGNILCGVTPINQSELSASFLYHYLNYKKDTLLVPLMKGGANVSLTVDSLKRVKVPVPPIKVQNKIVSMLDDFIALSAELKAELAARKKQYEYYRDKLLSFDVLEGASDVVWRTLEEVCVSISSGKAKTKGNYGLYPVYGSTGIIARTNTAPYDKVNILIARVGANAGYTHLTHGKYDVSDNTLVLDVKAEYNLKYIYYQLVNANLHQYAKGGGQPLVTAGQIKQIQVLIPSLPIQERIVSILDRFDALCNDLTSGLPAEIAARQKQYEYYRDKLLTFKEKVC